MAMNEYRLLTDRGAESASKEELIEALMSYGHTRESALQWIVGRLRNKEDVWYTFHIVNNRICNATYKHDFIYRRWLESILHAPLVLGSFNEHI
jgi:hypothetical protein